jgi:hypothetical protein
MEPENKPHVELSPYQYVLVAELVEEVRNALFRLEKPLSTDGLVGVTGDLGVAIMLKTLPARAEWDKINNILQSAMNKE